MFQSRIVLDWVESQNGVSVPTFRFLLTNIAETVECVRTILMMVSFSRARPAAPVRQNFGDLQTTLKSGGRLEFKFRSIFRINCAKLAGWVELVLARRLPSVRKTLC